MPIFHYFEDGAVMTPIFLNRFINHSGKQTITYRLYPQTKRADGEAFQELTEYTKLKMELYERNNADKLQSFDKQKLLLIHNSATKTDGKTFIAEGKDYYEFSFDFDAKVPYNLKGWENSKDLSKMDQKELLSKTEEAYQYYYNIIKNKKNDDYYRLTFSNLLAQSVTAFWKDIDLNEVKKEDEKLFNDSTIKLEPLVNYKICKYGNSKVVCLEQKSNDLRLQKESAIWGKNTNEKGGIEANFFKLYLHIPKGKDTFEIL